MSTNPNEENNFFVEDDIEVKEPLHLFDKWFKIVNNDPRTTKANAMCLSTVAGDGAPSGRFVLMKGYSKEGFVFFTHYTSRKGQEMEENSKVALTFYWEYYNRSVRIEGAVSKLPFSDADEYFSTRPYESQIGSSASDQSKPIAGRDVLTAKKQELREKHPEGQQVPRPALWGGYIVKPQSIEFWQGQVDRLHDRIRFRKPREGEPDGVLTHEGEDGWVYERLSP